MIFQITGLPLQLFGTPDVVGVKKGDPFASRCGYSSVSGGGHAAVRQRDYPDSGERGRDRCAAVVRTVVGNDDLKRFLRLRQYAFYRLSDIPLAVVYR